MESFFTWVGLIYVSGAVLTGCVVAIPAVRRTLCIRGWQDVAAAVMAWPMTLVESVTA